MNESLVRHNSKFNFSPFYFLQFRAPPSLFVSLFLFLHWSLLSKLLIQGSSWWWSSFFHGLFPSGWRLLSPLLLCFSLHLHGGKPPLKDLIEAQRSSLHRSSTSKLPSSTEILLLFIGQTFNGIHQGFFHWWMNGEALHNIIYFLLST